MPLAPLSKFLRVAIVLAAAVTVSGCNEDANSLTSGTTNLSMGARGKIERIAYATVGWDAPSERVDGTAIGALTGYRVYYGTSPTSLDKVLQVNDPASRTARVYSLTPGMWYFAVTVVDAEGMESERSVTASKAIT